MTQQVWQHPVYPPVGYRPGPYAHASHAQAGYAPRQYQPSTAAAQPPYGYAQLPLTNGLAIAALVLGVISALGTVFGIPLVVFAVFAAPAGVVGLILGIVARGKVRENQQQGAGMALAGILTASISLGLDLLLFVIAFVRLLAVLVN